MSVTSGFFNSKNGDRRYSAEQMSSIFDGVITDGVFGNIGKVLNVTADGSYTVYVDTGKAWFNSAWVNNDALLPLVIAQSEVALDRIDAVVVEIDHSDPVRSGSIKIVTGSASSEVKFPVLANEVTKHQYPLAYIYVKAGCTGINQADVTNMVGTSSCPFITSIQEQTDIDYVCSRWENQWQQWYAETIKEADFDIDQSIADMRSEFDSWFGDIRALLEDDVATNLSNEVALLMEKFNMLAANKAIYMELKDSNEGDILDSYGNIIYGSTVFKCDEDHTSGDNSEVESIETVKFTATIGTNWTFADGHYIQTITVPKIKETDDPIVDILPSSDFSRVEAELEAFGFVYRIITADNQIIVHALEPTTIPITVRLKEYRTDGKQSEV